MNNRLKKPMLNRYFVYFLFIIIFSRRKLSLIAAINDSFLLVIITSGSFLFFQIESHR